MAEAAPPEDVRLTYEEAAAHCGPSFTRRQIRNHVEQGRLTPIRIGQRTYISRAELDRMLRIAEGAPPYRKAS